MSQPVQLIVKSKKKKLKLTIDLNASVLDLKTKLQPLTEIPPSLQKIIYKGKVLSDADSLVSSGLKNKAKLTLVGSRTQDVISASSYVAPSSASLSKKRDEEKKAKEKVKNLELQKKYWSCRDRHQPIIKKGLPQNAMKAVKDQNDPLPKSIHSIYDPNGDEVRLSFHLDEQELWIATPSGVQKMLFTRIRDVTSCPIYEHEEYHIVALHLGSTEADHHYLYYVPAQYCKAIKYMISGNLNFPMLRHRSKAPTTKEGEKESK